jgi:hypothetical protein
MQKSLILKKIYENTKCVMKVINNSFVRLYHYYATDPVEENRVSAWSMKQALHFEMLSAGKHCNITQVLRDIHRKEFSFLPELESILFGPELLSSRFFLM